MGKHSRGRTRREFLRDVGLATGAATLASVAPGFAAAGYEDGNGLTRGCALNGVRYPFLLRGSTPALTRCQPHDGVLTSVCIVRGVGGGRSPTFAATALEKKQGGKTWKAGSSYRFNVAEGYGSLLGDRLARDWCGIMSGNRRDPARRGHGCPGTPARDDWKSARELLHNGTDGAGRRSRLGGGTTGWPGRPGRGVSHSSSSQR